MMNEVKSQPLSGKSKWFVIVILAVLSIETGWAKVTVVDSIMLRQQAGQGFNPVAVDVDPITNKIYVANLSSNNVSVIDGTNNKVVATITVGDEPYGICVNPVTNRVYVTNYFSDNVSVIDGTNNSVIATVAVGFEPWGICVNSTTNKIYVANYGSNNVSIIDGTNDSVVATISVGGSPCGICENPITNRIYVANSSSNNISIINGMNDTVIQAIKVGQNPEFIAINPQDSLIYVSCYDAGGVWVLKDDGIGVEENPKNIKNQDTKLEIYPNPIIHSISIQYYIPAKAKVSLNICDITGRTVRTLVNSQQEKGNYSIKLDTKGLPTGIYFTTLQTGNYKETKKLILVK